MGHSISAVIVREPFDAGAAERWDVISAPLDAGLRLIHLSPEYIDYWRSRHGATADLDVPAAFPDEFPRAGFLSALAAAVTGREDPTFAVVLTEYFGGVGDQWACVFVAGRRQETDGTINDALRVLGVRAAGDADEFDTVGLGRHRTTPEYLSYYPDED
ncbi:hypothetical protein KOI35_12055 [Actinoplanes bogorensis]|uniref:Uncharacterized protein n=1 Tax=Paractinoplanes bogorensis TaxID=1610840 RepID=A0ABS5YL83_9ACTN|nr:hypothetical protein [Actinoplanes bogorensis]MBU2664226.1 hypothetical protein [Actinoplanes bogorensis]